MINPYEPPQTTKASIDYSPSWLLITGLSVPCILALGYFCFGLIRELYTGDFDKSSNPGDAKAFRYIGLFLFVPAWSVLFVAHLSFLISRGKRAAPGLMYFYLGLSACALVTLGEGLGHWLGLFKQKPDIVPDPDFSYAWFLFGATCFLAVFLLLAYGHRHVWKRYQKTSTES